MIKSLTTDSSLDVNFLVLNANKIKEEGSTKVGLTQFLESKKNISRLIMQEDFLLLDKSFQLKIFITSAIIIYNVSKEHTKEKINEIKNNYNTLLKTESHYRDRMFLELITKKLNSGDFEKDKDVFLSNITDEESKELDIIGYNSWVKEYI